MSDETVPRPPLGIMPRKIWNERRRDDLILAMARYIEAGREVPRAWSIELAELIDSINLDLSIYRVEGSDG